MLSDKFVENFLLALEYVLFSMTKVHFRQVARLSLSTSPLIREAGDRILSSMSSKNNLLLSLMFYFVLSTVHCGFSANKISA